MLLLYSFRRAVLRKVKSKHCFGFTYGGLLKICFEADDVTTAKVICEVLNSRAKNLQSRKETDQDANSSVNGTSKGTTTELTEENENEGNLPKAILYKNLTLFFDLHKISLFLLVGMNLREGREIPYWE